MKAICLGLLLLCSQVLAGEETAVAAVIDDFHKAASEADGERYFAHLSEDAVFLGTDGGERWTKAAFLKDYGPYMEFGRGWTFVSVKRFISFSGDGKTAWFDEALDSPHYGKCRGSGVLVKRDGRWLIAQYNLSIPMPNDLAKGFVKQIREFEAAKD